MRRPRPTVRLRLTLTYTALFVVTGAALLASSYFLVRNREHRAGTAVQIICTRKTGPEALLAGPPVTAESGQLSSRPSNTQCSNAVGVYFTHSEGGGNVAVSGSASRKVEAPPAGLPGPTAAEVRQLTNTVKASQDHTLDSFRLESILLLALLTIASFGLSWWMAGRALQPVHHITDTARRLSEWTLHDRINLHGPNDELKQLADTFDAMLSRLEGAFQSQRRFAANASHELRTPLTTERVLIDEALANRTADSAELRSTLHQLRGINEDTERLIDALLVLARSERGVERRSRIDLSETVVSVVEQLRADALRADVAVSSEVESALVEGDPDLLERLVANLTENAIRHNTAGGSASIVLRRDGAHAVLDVTNSGARLDAATVATLVEPFRRARSDRSSNDGGVGLGLSIVDAIVRAHHGELQLAPRAGGGLRVRVQLPVTDRGGAALAAAIRGSDYV